MGKFKLKPKCGNHSEPNDKGVYVTYTSGAVIESNTDLVKRFPNKFIRVNDDSQDTEIGVSVPNIPKPKKEVTLTPEVLPKEAKKNSENAALKELYGDEITEEFPTAAIVNLKVFLKKNWCTVVDPEDDNIVLNEKKLRKNSVEKFLQEYVQEED